MAATAIVATRRPGDLLRAVHFTNQIRVRRLFAILTLEKKLLSIDWIACKDLYRIFVLVYFVPKLTGMTKKSVMISSLRREGRINSVIPQNLSYHLRKIE